MRAVEVDEAAQLLWREVRRAPWFTAVGVAEYEHRPAIVLYISSFDPNAFRIVEHGWQGYAVQVSESGRPMPIRVFLPR